jgi:propane monooxygenase reductase subunit
VRSTSSATRASPAPTTSERRGYTLLCRAHAYSDLEVELLHRDVKRLTSGVPIQTLESEVESIEPLTRDINRLP